MWIKGSAPETGNHFEVMDGELASHRVGDISSADAAAGYAAFAADKSVRQVIMRVFADGFPPQALVIELPSGTILGGPEQ